MKDLYFACCDVKGGIMHYVKDRDRYIFRDFTPCDRPMYIDIDGSVMHVLLRAPFSYCDHSAVLDFGINSDGSLSPVGTMKDTNGIVACHLCHAFGKVYYTNYLSGSVSSSAGELSVHEGCGKNPIRQEAPHTHYIAASPDGKYLLNTDLGLDMIFVYDKELRIISTANVPEGHGPRHLAYSCDGRFVFCVNELMSTVSVFKYDNGILTLQSTVSALIEKNADCTAAAIRNKDDRIYTSHRGNNEISVFAWRNEKLIMLGSYTCGGDSPRDIMPVENHIICANQMSDSVTFLDINGDCPELLNTVIKMPSPICIAVL